jgi:four helix bundle protein
MNYEEWEKTLPQAITGDSLWKVTAYRLALFIADLGWLDVTCLMKDRRTIGVSDQLYRALGSVGANIEAGYSRGTGKDRARFYEYALGSARESRGWYYKGRHILGEPVVQHRLQLLTEIVRLLLTMVPQQRTYTIREDSESYLTKTNITQKTELDTLLKNIPTP